MRKPNRGEKGQPVATASAQERLRALIERHADNLATLFLQTITVDFTVRMRNQLALELLDDENVIEDEPVLIFRGEQLGTDAAGSALPQIGLIIATNRRIRFASVDDSAAVDAPIETVRITHDEDGVLTFTWTTQGGHKEAATVRFENAKIGLIKQLRRLILESGKKVESGPATPRVTTWDRISRQRRR